ncbi:S41 family peptidase [Parapedobacter pyrenivorans]|uniref:S41 family peptidase n=1 Tax=Parapedobacter pyrenivorans TaxID=1305674 RepID=UPI0033414FA7
MNHNKHLLGANRVAILVFIILLFSAFAAVKDDLFLISKNLDIFSAVYRQISINYVDETDPDKLIKTAVDAMLDGLDPYTEYVQEADIDDYKLKYVDTRYGGIGTTTFNRDHRVYIAELYPGYPADRAGLQVGDELVRIDGNSLENKSTTVISQLLRGVEHSEVRLQIKRPQGDTLLELSITREAIRQPNVSHIALLDGGVGYIKLDKFLERSATEVEAAVTDLQKQGKLKGLVIDLRNNGGGILQEAVRVVNLFVPPGELVVSQRGKNTTKANSYRTTVKAVAPEIPLAVLINQHSASAAEIVAGALQDLDRAVVVGERSFGKGLVQQTFHIPYNNLVKVTVAKYYTPSGRCIQALDFAHRDDNGDYTHVSDSMIKAFNTKRGRVVYDGSGIHPDITVKKKAYSPVTKTLLHHHLIFDYATTFKQTHRQIPGPESFEVSETQYADFIRFLEDKDYPYFSKTETSLRQLKALAEAERKPDDILQELTMLEHQLSDSKQRDLFNHREELKAVLGNEIISRYYYGKGRTTFSFKHDGQLQRARALLTLATDEYYSILAGEGKYNEIGRPETFLAVAEAAN